MKLLPLTKGYSAMLDDAFTPTLKYYSAIRSNGVYPTNRGTTVSTLYNAVWESSNGPIPEGYTVDHIDRNPLNNQLDNLRLATPLQQLLNRGPMNTTYKGVSLHKATGKWRVTVHKDRKSHHIGMATSEHAGARMYNDAIKRLWADTPELAFCYFNPV